MTAEQAEVPNTPYHEQAAQQMSQFASQFGPEMERFFSGMMAHGGLPDINTMLQGMSDMGDLDRRKTQQAIAGSQHPMGSTSQSRAMAGAMNEGDLQRQLMRSQLGMQAHEGAMGRMFGGAQGLAGMPGIYGAPAGIEASMFGITSPYDLANLQARQQTGMTNLQSQLQRQSAMNEWMARMGLYQPDRIQTPSSFEKYVNPFLQAGASFAGDFFKPIPS